MQATPQTDTESPVTAAELAQFIGVASDDALLDGMLIAATDAVIRYINQDLIEREWVGIVPVPKSARLQLSPYVDPSTTFELPYTALLSVESVTGNDDEALEYTLESQRRPAKITVHGWDFLSEIRIEYTAGMVSIPASIKSAIMMMAAYLYDHRGDCDADGGIKKSGAAMLLRPYRVEVSL
jgi:uncharacterized phiE125 gp8 family phage protein